MFGWLLNIVYAGLLLALSPWLLYCARTKAKYREGWGAKLLGRVPAVERSPGEQVLWFHAVSVGEVKQLDVLFREIHRRRLPWRCVVSTTTKSGYDLARMCYLDKTVFYCPLDFTWAVARAMRQVQPDMLVLAELELWPNLIRAADNRGVAVAIVNGRLSERSFRGYRRLRWMIAPLLRRLSLVATQTSEYADRFERLGLPADRLRVSGTLKFDGVETDRDNARSRQLRSLAQLDDAAPVFMAGSTCDGEEPIVLDAYQKLLGEFPTLQLILVPRHPDRFELVARLLVDRRLAFVRRSQLGGKGNVTKQPILLVDTIGELSHWWAAADVAFVGGSLASGRGGQNMIEPAAYGAAVCFGPDTGNFRDVVENLLARDAAVVVQHAEELADFVRHMLSDRSEAAARGERAAEYVAGGRGATIRTVDALETITTARAPATLLRPAA